MKLLKQAYTKEERFLLHLYKKAMEANNIREPFEYAEIAKTLGQSEKGVKTTVQILASTNFIKKIDKTHVSITAHGERLVQELEE
jgi:Mn-dependent DtxR family transcriptional regulator